MQGNRAVQQSDPICLPEKKKDCHLSRAGRQLIHLLAQPLHEEGGGGGGNEDFFSSTELAEAAEGGRKKEGRCGNGNSPSTLSSRTPEKRKKKRGGKGKLRFAGRVERVVRGRGKGKTQNSVVDSVFTHPLWREKKHKKSIRRRRSQRKGRNMGGLL